MKSLFAMLCLALLVSNQAQADEAVKNLPLARVHVFSSGENGIFANAYLIETANSVVAIDATLLDSTSKALREKTVALGKPLRAVLLTHGHPDHYNGVTNLLAGKTVDVLATAGTDRVIRESDAAKERQWRPVFGTEWPEKRTFPNRILADGQSITIDGVKFTVRDLGAGESHSDSYWLVETGVKRIAFIGDVVLHDMHAYVSDGHTTAWLKNLERLEQELKGIERLYPGHGESGRLELFQAQRRYVVAYRAAIAALAQGRPTLTDEQKKELASRMNEFLPSPKLAFLVPLGADAVAAELAAAR